MTHLTSTRSLSTLTPTSILRIKCNNTRPHTPEEISYFISSFTQNQIPDYQMSAWLMAICLNGMNHNETSSLTSALMQTGHILNWSTHKKNRPIVDKHSTGGVGDKVSLILAPLVASFDVLVPMMAGRGLAHTGGTIDKLESIPGMKCQVSNDEFQCMVDKTGVAIVSAGDGLVPADRKMYALRDVTETVLSVPLQTSSIMSKKLAENPESVILDVKFGKGSFQKTQEESIHLAQSLIATGTQHRTPTTAFITRMDQPLGNAVGNWIEVMESIQTLQNSGPKDLTQLCLIQASQMLLQANVVKDWKEGIQKARAHLENGMALKKFWEMVESQGGDVNLVKGCTMEGKRLLGRFQEDVISTSSGYVTSIDAMDIGLTSILIGAGREAANDSIDHSAGIQLLKKIGDEVVEGEKLATIYSNSEETASIARLRVADAYVIEREKKEEEKLITHFVTNDGVEEFDMSILYF